MEHTLTADFLAGQTVLLRLDLDVPVSADQVSDDSRLLSSLETLKFCSTHAKRVVILGHLARPDGYDESLSLKPVIKEIERLLDQPIFMVPFHEGLGKSYNNKIVALDNLRFFDGEAKADPEFGHKLASMGTVFVNEAFAVAHRSSASTTLLPSLLPSRLGFSFANELAALETALQTVKHPIIMIMGGIKADKIENVDMLLKNVDNLLLGGRLVDLVQPQDKLVLASLTPDGLDITAESATVFSSLLRTAGTIIWNGPLGKFEDPSYNKGTTIVANAMASTTAFKIAGGGDTLAAIHQLGLESKFDHLSTAGGAMLYYIAHKTLPAHEAILHSPSKPSAK
ncbi:hypothetical protein A2368_03290 [Candidatus Collierbacteria bacterium RIFOXYB1_FULL_49_13]|uniref:Phosphoglycerate kinase n=1 Tax=Candidatus Collierbacteria bacterium RIFOXYB1_FULL_49_13 TaxID=1817728 RepID=A0A1F5FGW8_9BACT|nr:MAG: hypothetical protein A2368_03290 [Candidatus Collierbacteria bacterium RIFOXYB1_FULL_49_13]